MLSASFVGGIYRKYRKTCRYRQVFDGYTSCFKPWGAGIVDYDEGMRCSMPENLQL